MKKLTYLFFLLTVFFVKASSEKQVDEWQQATYSLFSVDLDSASILAEKSLTLAKEIDYEWGEGNAYFILGYIYGRKKNPPKALVMYLKASRIFELLEDERSVKTHIRVLSNSGKIMASYFKYDEAIEFYEKALTYEESRDLKLGMIPLYNKAWALREKGHYEQAIDILEEVILLATTHRDNVHYIKSLNLLGLINHDNQFYDTALEYYNYILSSPLASDKDKAKALHNLALSYYKMGEHDESKNYYERALKYKRDLNDPRLLFNTLIDLADWHLVDKNLETAMEYARECEELYPSIMSEPETFKLFRILRKIYYQFSDLDQMEESAEKYFVASSQFIDYQEKLLEIKAQHEMDLVLMSMALESEANQAKASDQNKTRVIVILVACTLIIIVFFLLKIRGIKRFIAQMIYEFEDSMKILQ